MLTLPTYRQWQAFRATLPLPSMLACIACGVRIDWRAYDVARRSKRDGIEREQVAIVRVGALCKVRQYEWYIPPDGSSEDIIESWKKMVIPFHASGIGCVNCQGIQSRLDAQAMRDLDALTAKRGTQRTILAIPFQFDPRTNLRLPTAVSTRNTYVRARTRHTPVKRIAWIDVTQRVLELDAGAI